MLDKLGSLMASFPTENFQVPSPNVNLPAQNWQGKLKDLGTPGQGLEQLVILADMFGRGLDKRAGGTGAGFGGAEMAQSSLANRAAKERQDQWNQLLSRLIGGMTPGTNPGGNSLKVTPIEGGGSKLTYDHTIGKDGEGADAFGPSENPNPASWMGNAMKNFPFY